MAGITTPTASLHTYVSFIGYIYVRMYVCMHIDGDDVGQHGRIFVDGTSTHALLY
jgi:hypothetical protein